MSNTGHEHSQNLHLSCLHLHYMWYCFYVQKTDTYTIYIICGIVSMYRRQTLTLYTLSVVSFLCTVTKQIFLSGSNTFSSTSFVESWKDQTHNNDTFKSFIIMICIKTHFNMDPLQILQIGFIQPSTHEFGSVPMLKTIFKSLVYIISY